MAPSSDKHLFISYAHRDNQPLIEGKPGWIDQFERVLQVRLGQLLGKEPKIWRDHTVLQGNDVFAAVIEQGLCRSAVLVPVITPSYRNSEWCEKEMTRFCEAAERAGGIRVGNATRIFKVIKTPIPREEEPPLLQDLIGYEFFRRDSSGRVREFLLHGGEQVDPEYLRKVDDLAEDIRLLIERVLNAAGPSDLRDSTEQPVVYVAETTSDVATDRERLLRTLRQRGYGYLPDRRLPFATGSEYRSAIREAMSRSRLSVHLIGGLYGGVPEAETESVVAIQDAIAAEVASERPFPRLVWIAPGVETADPRQRGFLDRLRDQPGSAEILSGSLEELETLLEDRLRPPPKPVAQADSALKYVYVLCAQCDLEGAEAVRDWLFDHVPDVEVVLPLFEGDETEIHTLHVETLKTCQGVLIYYGKSGEPWLRAKLLELQKAAGYGRNRPFAAKAICLAPPSSPAKQRFRTREALVFPDFAGPTAECLDSFLKLLRSEGRSDRG
jgi:hypothetical protein